jgi:hypothetical protein
VCACVSISACERVTAENYFPRRDNSITLWNRGTPYSSTAVYCAMICDEDIHMLESSIAGNWNRW